MPGLILKLRAHEQILVNGVVMQNGDRNARLIIKTPDANILRLRDAIHPDDANTPVSRVCYILQLILAGEAEIETAKAQALAGIEQLAAVFVDPASAASLSQASTDVAGGRFYPALRALRSILPAEGHLMALSARQ